MYIYASVLYQYKRHNTYTYISRRKWGKFPGSSRGGTHGCHTLTCHIYVICIACHASCKPSGTKSLEAFFNCTYMLQFCINTRDTTHTHIYHGGSGGSFRARPEAEPMDAIHSHAICVICIAFQSRASTLEHKPP